MSTSVLYQTVPQANLTSLLPQTTLMTYLHICTLETVKDCGVGERDAAMLWRAWSTSTETDPQPTRSWA